MLYGYNSARRVELMGEGLFSCSHEIESAGFSGVETRGSGGSINRGPELLGVPNGAPKIFTKMCEMTVLQSTRKVFDSRRGHLRTQKASKPLAAGGPHWGSFHRSPDPGPVAGHPQSPPRSQHFGLPASALGAEPTEGLEVTVELWRGFALCLLSVRWSSARTLRKRIN